MIAGGGYDTPAKRAEYDVGEAQRLETIDPEKLAHHLLLKHLWLPELVKPLLTGVLPTVELRRFVEGHAAAHYHRHEITRT